jgi:hypothetical protein
MASERAGLARRKNGVKPKNGMRLRKHTMAFDGLLLQRGFWLYVWRIRSPQGLYVYVGRTGDSSSPHAASPFSRMARHLDARANAKSNAMMRQIVKAGLDPTRCRLEFVAFGPLFPEQRTMKSHRPIRDKMAAAEHALATFLRQRGYTVLGTHSKSGHRETGVLERLRSQLVKEFPPN